MYISDKAIVASLKQLENIHPFFGITFLVCKKDSLPIGTPINYPINTNETHFLEQYFRPVKKTKKFYRPFRTSDKNKYWNNEDYASSGSQATRTQIFADVFVHEKHTDLWGWSVNYLSNLKNHLKKDKIPAFALAFWILKDKLWQSDTSPELILQTFFDDFNITKKEIDVLFNLELPKQLDQEDILSPTLYNWSKICETLNIPSPPDLPIEKGGYLQSLELNGIDESRNFNLEFASRFNIITGDNGLGKSFILEAAWWSLTQQWTGFPIFPSSHTNKQKPSIKFKLTTNSSRVESYAANFNWLTQTWAITNHNKNLPGLVIYARVDGAFAIWDPARIQFSSNIENASLPPTLLFSREDVWDGVRIGEGSKSRSLFNGLITDWVHWQTSQNTSFTILKKILKKLSPPDLEHGDLGILEPGNIVRIPGESRPMPTIKHPYGEVPIIFASAAVKRIIAFAYLIVWTWEEHKTSAQLIREVPQNKMVVIADEIEAHLHPQWQRVILPSLSSIDSELNDKLKIQFLITTHSPLVMASIEPHYDETIDKIFHLNLKTINNGNAKIVLETPEFHRIGSIDAWLTSSIFELKQPRSIEAEEVISQAKTILATSNANRNEIQLMSQKLMLVLPPHDTFWIRWNYFAEKKGAI